MQPVINLQRDHLLDADLVHGDETVIQVLKEPGRAVQIKSYLWAQMNGAGPPVRLFGEFEYAARSWSQAFRVEMLPAWPYGWIDELLPLRCSGSK